MNLRAYQGDTVRECYTCWRAGHRKVLLCAPTGAGKTEMAIRITLDCLARGWRAFFIVDQQNLTVQTVQRLAASGITPGVVWAEADPGMNNPSRMMQVCSLQTMQSQRKRGGAWWEKCVSDPHVLWIFDEAHDKSAWSELGQWLIGNVSGRVLGLTGSPFRLSPQEGMGDLFDAIAQTPAYQGLIDLTVPELVAQYQAHGHQVDHVGGILPMRYIALKAKIDTSGVSKTAGDWDQKEIAARAMLPAVLSAQLVAWREQCLKFAGRELRTLGFCATVEHATAAARYWSEQGVVCGVVTGMDATTGVMVAGEFERVGRQDVCRRLAKGAITAIFSIAAMIKGVDIPEIECGLCLRPTMSQALVVQMTGRIRRPCAWLGKLMGLWLDATTNFTAGALQLPEMITRFELTKGQEKKGKAKDKAKNKPPEQIECHECGTLVGIKAKVCPACGYSFEVELELIEKKRLELEAKEISKALGPDRNKRFFRALLHLTWFGGHAMEVEGYKVPAIGKMTGPSGAYALYTQAVGKQPSMRLDWREGAIFAGQATEDQRWQFWAFLVRRAARRTEAQRAERSDDDYAVGWYEGEFGVGSAQEVKAMAVQPIRVNLSSAEFRKLMELRGGCMCRVTSRPPCRACSDAVTRGELARLAMR